METKINRLNQTVYGENGSRGLLGKVDDMCKQVNKLNSKITLAGGVIIGLQLAMAIGMFVIQIMK